MRPVEICNGERGVTIRAYASDTKGVKGQASLPTLFAAALLFAAVLVVPLPAPSAVPPPVLEAPVLKPTPRAAEIVPTERWVEAARTVRRIAARYGGRVGVYVRDHATGREIAIRPDERFPSASLHKIPVMLAVEAEVERGRIGLDAPLVVTAGRRAGGSGLLKRRPAGSIVRVDEALDLMITRSDNTATNLLVDLVGREAVNRAARALGGPKTVMRRDVMDLEARDEGVENWTTPRETARMLEAIHAGTAVSRAASERMLRRLLGQRVNDRIPRLLPRGASVAHKTGLMNNIVSDAGIVVGPDGRTLTVAVFVEPRGSYRSAKRLVAEVARAAYEAAAD